MNPAKKITTKKIDCRNTRKMGKIKCYTFTARLNMHRLQYILLALLLCLSIQGRSAVDSTAVKEFYELKERAERLTEIALFEQSVNEWTAAIDLAKATGHTEQYLDASISMAELFRKTADFERALELLTSLEATKNYPRLHVRKLGRLAAIHHERNPQTTEEAKIDTVRFYIQKALELATALHFKKEEASLKNELGYLLIRNADPKKGMPLLFDAASIFRELNDTISYINSMTHVVDGYHRLKETRKEDSTANALARLLKGTNWYATKIDLYNLIAHSALKRGDSSKYYRWAHKVDDALVSYYGAINTRKMAAFRIYHDTKRYQEDAEVSKTNAQLKAEELEKQRARTRELTIYLSILGIFILLVVGLFIRERRLKAQMDLMNQDLQVANDKYQMLMVESNHRIKNNLQMVISMLQYTSKEMDSTNTKALKRISSKIHTISALHKHLYLDVHNERVGIDTYFNEITAMYEEIAPDEFQVNGSIFPVGIKSERIVYFGLIFNEMLSNTLEHQKSEHKTVNISISQIGEQYQFSYFDGSDIPVDSSMGMGRKLIEQLIRRVGGKNYEFNPSKGHYQFNFDD